MQPLLYSRYGIVHPKLTVSYLFYLIILLPSSFLTFISHCLTLFPFLSYSTSLSGCRCLLYTIFPLLFLPNYFFPLILYFILLHFPFSLSNTLLFQPPSISSFTIFNFLIIAQAFFLPPYISSFSIYFPLFIAFYVHIYLFLYQLPPPISYSVCLSLPLSLPDSSPFSYSV